MGIIFGDYEGCGDAMDTGDTGNTGDYSDFEVEQRIDGVREGVVRPPRPSRPSRPYSAEMWPELANGLTMPEIMANMEAHACGSDSEPTATDLYAGSWAAGLLSTELEETNWQQMWKEFGL